MTVRIQLVTLG